ncbi:MAG: folylpolyglutamate synthase/dihydrofolate synthase family protein [Pseudomonadota bacterium]
MDSTGADAERLQAFLSDLSERRPRLIDLSLGRVEETLKRLGRPHLRLPPTFHVAGTNGKGSTVAFLKAILEASDASVHVFTSPHLVRYNERITLAGREIHDAELLDVLERVDAAARELTFFETIACAAFVAYAETPADYLLLEVGLGGRLDATNVVEAPLCAVVSAIGLDHQAFLGDTLAAIAREKAGVFKPDRPAVIGAQEPEAMAALIEAADATGARAFVHGTDWTFWEERGRLSFQDGSGVSDLDRPRLIGAHQAANAALAVAALRAAGLSLSDETISKGLSSAAWPARMQRLGAGDVVDALGGDDSGREVWLDGGHNPHAASALAATLADLDERSPKPIVLIVGMQETKDAAGFFAPFAGLARHVVTTSAKTLKASEPRALAASAREAGIPTTTSAELCDALRAANAVIDGPARFLIVGSLHLAGETLAMNAGRPPAEE